MPTNGLVPVNGPPSSYAESPANELAPEELGGAYLLAAGVAPGNGLSSVVDPGTDAKALPFAEPEPADSGASESSALLAADSGVEPNVLAGAAVS
jgi:hypothetical protein